MLAEGRIDDPERRNHYLRIVSAESARLTRLIEGVLSFARMEKGIAAPERRDCDLVEIAREAVGVCLPQAESAGVTIATEMLVDALPLAGDRDSLAQIVFNLLSNAEKYGGGEILLRVRRETRTGYGIVEVLDRGPGIPHGMAEAIFRPFYRLDDSLASGVSGSGLGLTLARRMAREHGGEVSYAPREGGGSCFTLAVPLGPPR
jgi:signal transduction histidine kinase